MDMLGLVLKALDSKIEARAILRGQKSVIQEMMLRSRPEDDEAPKVPGSLDVDDSFSDD